MADGDHPRNAPASGGAEPMAAGVEPTEEQSAAPEVTQSGPVRAGGAAAPPPASPLAAVPAVAMPVYRPRSSAVRRWAIVIGVLVTAAAVTVGLVLLLGLL